MTEFTPPEDPMSAILRLAFQAGTRAVCEAASLYGWDAVQAANPGAGLEGDLSANEQAILFGAIQQVLAGRVPSPFASNAGGRADA